MSDSDDEVVVLLEPPPKKPPPKKKPPPQQSPQQESPPRERGANFKELADKGAQGRFNNVGPFLDVIHRAEVASINDEIVTDFQIGGIRFLDLVNLVIDYFVRDILRLRPVVQRPPPLQPIRWPIVPVRNGIFKYREFDNWEDAFEVYHDPAVWCGAIQSWNILYQEERSLYLNYLVFRATWGEQMRSARDDFRRKVVMLQAIDDPVQRQCTTNT